MKWFRWKKRKKRVDKIDIREFNDVLRGTYFEDITISEWLSKRVKQSKKKCKEQSTN